MKIVWEMKTGESFGAALGPHAFVGGVGRARVRDCKRERERKRGIGEVFCM